MAKSSVLQRNIKRAATIKRFSAKRIELKNMIINMNLDDETRLQAQYKLQSLPRDAMPVRYRRRCPFHGRGRGVYRKFGICRNKLRDSAMFGEIPGLVKASW